MPASEGHLPDSPRPSGIHTALRRVGKSARFWLAFCGSAALAAILTLEWTPRGPGPLGGWLPQEGEIADRSYKATVPLAVVDREATEELRRAAAEQAPAIYDFDERRPAQVRETLQTAFAAARAARPAERAEPARPRGAFRQALGEAGTGVREGTLEVLARGKFSEQDERAVVALVGPIVARMIVDDAPLLTRQLPQRPVIARAIGSGEEQRVQRPHAVLSLEDARDLLRAEGASMLADRPLAEQAALLELALALVRPNTSANLRATEERRTAAVALVKDVTQTLRRGEIIVRDGDAITAHHLRLLTALAEKEESASQLPGFLGVAGALLLLLVAVWRLGKSSMRGFPRELKDSAFLLGALVFSALGTRVGLFLCDALAERPELAALLPQGPEPLYYVLPWAAAPLLVRLVHSAETSALFALLAAVVAGLQVRGEISYAVYVLVGALTAALGASRVTARGALLRAGMRVGLAQMGAVAALELLRGAIDPAAMLFAVLLAGLAGLLAAILASGLAPAIETLFGYTTDVKLVELANREQAVLRELELRAPGTYHHSMMVGHLAEKAAEAIGANALLAKVAGYYHDIGKMRRPHFFVENAPSYGGENRHEKLSPPMSARIIQAHVKDGLEIGRDHRLAGPILSGIAQHHGTSVIRFFYEKAKEQLDPDKGETVAEHEYRYSGPRPQTRESGILMLADSVEAASRTLSDDSPSRIQQLVQRVINNYFRDGQLDECNLTLRDLNLIARSMIETLSAIRHERIDYPEPTDAEGRALPEREHESVVERLEPRQKDRQERAEKKREDDLRRLGIP
jgi:hypothetical protein